MNEQFRLNRTGIILFRSMQLMPISTVCYRSCASCNSGCIFALIGCRYLFKKFQMVDHIDNLGWHRLGLRLDEMKSV